MLTDNWNRNQLKTHHWVCIIRQYVFDWLGNYYTVPANRLKYSLITDLIHIYYCKLKLTEQALWGEHGDVTGKLWGAVCTKMVKNSLIYKSWLYFIK